MKQVIRLTESDLHNMIKESVKQVLKENVDFYTNVSELCQELANFLQTNGVESATFKRSRGGSPMVSVSTNEKQAKPVAKLCAKFCSGKNIDFYEDFYPATTYFHLEPK